MNDIEFIRNELTIAIREIDELKAANSRLMQRISDLEVDMSCEPHPDYAPELDELSRNS